MRSVEIAKNVIGYTATVAGLGCTAVALFLAVPIQEARQDVAEVELYTPKPPEDLEQLPESRQLDYYESLIESMFSHLEEIKFQQDQLTTLTDLRFDLFVYAAFAGGISFTALWTRRPEDSAPGEQKPS